MRFWTVGLVVIALLSHPPLNGQQTGTAPRVSLHAAAFRGDSETIRRHVQSGADLNEKDIYGSTPLIIATTFGQTEAARVLIEAGADLEVSNNDGSSALHIAAFLCRTEIVEALLRNGADRRLRNNAGHTAQQVVEVPFEAIKSIYDDIGRALAPLGLNLDYDRIRTTRPRIAQMLRPGAEQLQAVEYAPLPGKGWKVSTPLEQGLDPQLAAELYFDAGGLSTLYALLIVKNGHLIAEAYFNDGSFAQMSSRQSVTKSYLSALVGIALDQGCLGNVDQAMLDHFPEFADRRIDPRKKRITIRDMLQMRAGYPWEERTPPYNDLLFFRGDWHWLPHLVDFPLSSDPGTEFNYSNLTSHLLGVITARACKTDLKSFAQKNLFSPIGAQLGEWKADADDYNWGAMEIQVTARDMARFGLLYLRRGRFGGNQVVPVDWVRESLQKHSQGIRFTEASSSSVGRYIHDVGYGYQWWSARAGEHRFDFAWGHGGNLIVLLGKLDMIIVTTADPLHFKFGDEAWRHEGAIIDLVGRFIHSLPEG